MLILPKYDLLTKPEPGTPLDSDDPINFGLIGLWPFWEGAGSKLEDISGLGNHGTLTNGPAWVPGRAGSALSFDGVNDFVDCGAGVALQVQTNSMSAWINPALLTPERPIINREDIGADGWEWSLGPSTAAKISYAYYDGATRGWYQSTGSITANVWTHVVGVWRQSDGKVDFYFNGILDSTVNTTTGTITHNAARTCRIGRRTNSAGAFNGLIDNVRVYNRALSASEVLRVFYEPFAGFSISVLWYPPTTAAPIVVIPSTATLTLSTFAPTIRLDKVVAPTTLAIVTTTFAPTILSPRIVKPGVIDLVVTGFAPVIRLDKIVQPSTVDLITATFAPIVATPRVVKPATLAITITGFAPTILSPRIVKPATTALLTTVFPPVILLNVVARPATLALSTDAFVPTIRLHKIVKPTTLALTMTTFASTIQISGMAPSGTRLIVAEARESIRASRSLIVARKRSVVA